MNHRWGVAVLLWALAFAPAAWASSIQGQVALHAPTDADRTVVYLELPAGMSVATKPMHARLSQKGAKFRPAVLPIVKGSDVDMTNDDWIDHSVFSMSLAKVFDLGLYGKGESRVVTFDKAGKVEIGCYIHPQMGAVILVLDHPYFTKPGQDGHFEIPNVPPGKYQLKVFQKGAAERSVTVTVPASGTVTAEL